MAGQRTPHVNDMLRPSEDEASLAKFTPMSGSIEDVRRAIPLRLFKRYTKRGLAYLARDVLMAAIVWYFGTYIDVVCASNAVSGRLGHIASESLRWSVWCIYWWFQGLVFTGVWVIGHECGHGAFSESRLVCDIIGFITHTALWTPYFSWRISHHRHHSNHASMERDEVYVPKTRTDLGLPNPKDGAMDYEELFGDTPVYTLYMLVRQQLLGFPAYLLYNVSGQKNYPWWTSHYDPTSVLFTKSQRNAVILSNIGTAAMVYAVRAASDTWGFSEVIKYYGIPWLCVNHWFTMITYLHHTDPMLPHYRNSAWTFSRGAAATVDRDFLGWQGDFFLHGVAHFHVIHHFFPKMPFYHGPEATKYLREFIGDYYHYSDKPAFKALWDNYNDCQFVEDTGDVLFYKNKRGQAVLAAAEGDHGRTKRIN